MTLMEVVIAMGVVAFAVPMFLALSKSAGDSRMNAEADTRSAWLVREVQREMLQAWANPGGTSIFGMEIDFPTFGSEAAPAVLAFDFEGNFIAPADSEDIGRRSNIPNATYLVAVHGEAHTPANSAIASDKLSLISIRVLHPAKAPPENRREYRYNLISARPGIL